MKLQKNCPPPMRGNVGCASCSTSRHFNMWSLEFYFVNVRSQHRCIIKILTGSVQGLAHTSSGHEVFNSHKRPNVGVGTMIEESRYW